MASHNDVDYWLCPDQLFENGVLKHGRALGITEGKVEAVKAQDALPQNVNLKRVAGIISPGFVDLQVNGGGGVLLNATPTAEAMWAIAKAHRQFGTTALLPTVITDHPDILGKAAQAALTAFGKNGVCGLHIEGPHISQRRRGTHNADHIRPFDDMTLNSVDKLCMAKIPVMITLAPEIVPPDHIAKLVNMGAIVSIGHSEAAPADITAARLAGARCFTHLFNAMSPMQGRDPGVTGTAILSSSYVGIICDGIHVADDMVALALRARPEPNLTFLVSDAMPTVGGPSQFDLYGQSIKLDQGRLINAEGSLAGAHTTLAAGIRRLVSNLNIPVQTALKMAISVPCAVMGLDLDRLQGQKIEALLHLNAQGSYTGPVSQISPSQKPR